MASCRWRVARSQQGARRWLNLGFMAFQPSELLKLALPLMLAWYFQRNEAVLRAKQVPYDITYIDRDNRPAWFLAVSPHSKVPVLQIDGKEALFESNAIAEYLEETAAPRLHPEDPVARARNRGGSGLGLSIVDAAVSAHGGSVDIDSVEGRGTTVRLVLPAHA